MPRPSIRAGFPVVATNAAAAAPYTVTTGTFSASFGDELCAIVMGGGLPVVTSRNAADTGPGTLTWVRRFVVRVNFPNTSTNVAGAQQVAIYTAVVPAGGVTERATYTTTTTANDGGQTLSPNSLPARLAVFAVDDTNGIGAIAWKGSIATGGSGSNDVTTGLAATQTIKPFGTDSLILGGGWFVDGSTPTPLGNCSEVIAPGTNRMPVWSAPGGSAGANVTFGSSITDSALWALGMVEYLPTSTPKPAYKLFCFGDSGIESTNSARQTAVVVQDALAPNWELFNQGVWWAHTGQTLSRWTAENAAYPDFHAAIVQVGMNDIADNGTVWNSTSQSNLAGVYTGLAAINVPLACYTGIGPLATPSVVPAAYYEFRDWVTANSPAGSHLYSLDLVTDPGAGYLSVFPAYQAPDGNHISAAGNAITGANIAAWVGALNVIDITAGPADQTVNAGATATFSVTATGGTAPLTYQWRKNGTNISGANSTSYVTPTAAYSDQGAKFDCVVTDADGLSVTSAPARLIVATNLAGTGPRIAGAVGFGPVAAGPGLSQLRGTASAGGAAALEAAVLSQASASAALTTQISLTAGLTAQATITAALSAGIRLEANAQAQATLGGALSTGIAMSAAAASTSTVTGALSTGIVLAAAPQAQATVTGGLTTGIALASSAQAVTTITAALTTGAGGMSAAVQSVAAVGASLTTGISLAAAAQSIATVSASLAGSAAALQSSAVGQSTVTAALSTGIQLQAAAAAQSTVTAPLTSAITLAAAPAAACTVTAALTGGIRLASSVQSVVTVSATLAGTAAPLSASAQAQASCTAALTTGISLAAGVICQAQASAALTAQIALQAIALAQSTASAQLTTGDSAAGTSDVWRFDVPASSLRLDVPASSLRFDIPSIVAA